MIDLAAGRISHIVRRRHVTGLPLLVLGQYACAGKVVSFVGRTGAAASPVQGTYLRQRALYIIGDSTAAEFPEADARVGWGAVLGSLLTGLQVVNAARSGRSSKSFRDEGHYRAVEAELRAGDLLLVQFGHNDEKDDPARATDAATTFRDNLRRYIDESRARGAVPVLLTPISRRRFAGERVTPSHGAFPEATRAVAAETRTPLIDMTPRTERLLERYGPATSEQLFAPNDNTHLSALGAHAVAGLVAAALVELGFDVRARAHEPALTFFPAHGPASGTTVIVCPGGGYTHLSLEKEGNAVASWLNGLGIAAFVLRYRLADFGHPAPLADVLGAVRLVRAQVANWNGAANRIGVLGFSAGGHLAACASCLFDDEAARPDFAILAYPVITLKPPFAHAGSRRALLGPDPDPALVDSLSLETRVTAQTPPTFLMHTHDDASVPVENSRMYQAALERAGVPSELHLYDHGPHGLALNPETEAGREWPKACEAWLKANNLLA
jgi:acetyl esterase/lipase